MHSRLITAIFGSFLFTFGVAAQQNQIPSFDEMTQSKHDVWGEAAMREPNGASYEFFAKLLPPPRYVNADFQFYPIVLSAPKTKVKARLISNGSGVNLDGGTRSWLPNGTPMVFRVGPDEELFGAQLHRVTHPTLAEGYLPIAEMRYKHPTPVQSGGNIPLDQKRVDREPEIYQLEAFASVDPALAENGVVFVKFSLAQGTNGLITVDIGSKSPVKFSDGKASMKKEKPSPILASHGNGNAARHMRKFPEPNSHSSPFRPNR